MFAQLVKSRVRPGKEEEARNLSKEFDSRAGQTAAPWVALTASVNMKDPGEFYTLIVFESEEKARENERSPEQAKRVERLMEIYENPEYVDLDVVFHRSR
jgi:hypothetical protein